MCNRRSICCWFCCLAVVVAAPAFGDEMVPYSRIKPILAEKCYSCHGALKQEAELRIETRALMLKGGDSGPVLVAGNPDDSLLLQRIAADEDERMPPAEEGSALKPEEVALVRSWIKQGAIAPEEKIPLAPQQHWAFQRVERPDVPRTGGAATNPIDAFLQAKRDRHALKAQPAASQSLLIRRLYLDLTGLPPTREQLHDTRPWEQIVDELLVSPQHGERWARHWMDIWRYSDWYGLGNQLRNSQKHLWHWRDWIVESLNEDKGYDRMIQEMLAADEIAPNDQSALRATGFLARNYYLFNRTTWLDDTIEHTGKAFLGLTLNCAKCHDHKYDPITQVDYYRFRAIFEPHQVRLDPLPGVTDLDQNGLPRVFDDHLDIETFLHIRGDSKNPDKTTKITPGVPGILASFAKPVEPVALPADAYAPGLRDYVQQDRLAAASANVNAARKEFSAAREKLRKTPKEQPQVAEAETKPASTDATFNVADDFAKANPELWEITGDGWEYRDGALHQTKPTRENAAVWLKQPHPRDFELTCRFTTTGGTTYKSVTFRFDQSEDKQFGNFVYSSAHEPDPKVHVAYTRNGKNQYPPEGRTARPIKVGETYELKFAVRDTLVNVWLNGKFILAYQLPSRSTDGNGRLSLSGFDATVAFDSVRIRSLPADFKLTDAGKTAPSAAPKNPRKAAELAVKTAEAKLAAVELRLAAIRAVFAAERARLNPDEASETRDQLAARAAKRQAEAMQAEAEHELLKATKPDQRKAAESKKAKAQKKLEADAKGDLKYSTIRASRKALESPAHKEPDYPAIYPSTSTGRRKALAEWLTSRNNPLTARVAVNQVWMRHFGEPLVESVTDFGLRAKRPEHAELLDFLAAEFMESSWSFRHLHRMIVTSEAYQLSSSSLKADAATLTADPTNRYYWRMNPRRMESQVIRDSLLQLAGTLDLKVGGPSLNPGKSNRRSLYFRHSRDQQDKFLAMFDDADHLQCYRRSDSIVPQQALALSNSALSIQSAEKIAGKLAASGADDPEAFIESAFELLLARLPNDAEREECQRFWREMSALLEKADANTRQRRIRTRLVHSLLNHNDFISIR